MEQILNSREYQTMRSAWMILIGFIGQNLMFSFSSYKKTQDVQLLELGSKMKLGVIIQKESLDKFMCSKMLYMRRVFATLFEKLDADWWW